MDNPETVTLVTWAEATSCVNASGCNGSAPALPTWTLGWGQMVLAGALGILALATFLGNLLVILAVACFTRMRTLSNGLLTSLALADLAVSKRGNI